MDIKAQVAKNIRFYRHQAGLSQQKLADRVGKSIRYVNYIENRASNITIEVLQALAEGIGVPIYKLIVGEKDTANQLPKSARTGLEYALQLIKSALATDGEETPKRKKHSRIKNS